MSDLIDKLNLLLRSGLNNVLGGTDRPSTSGKISLDRLGKDVDREIAALRQQVDKALAEEDDMSAKLQQLDAEVANLDQQADERLQRGDEAQARYLLQQMRGKEQKAEIARAELDRHKTATFDLMQHVNTLEAMVSDARRQQAEKNTEKQSDTRDDNQNTAPQEANVESAPGPAGFLSEMLRNARERVEGMIGGGPLSPLSPTAPPPQAPPPAAESAPDAAPATDAPRKIKVNSPTSAAAPAADSTATTNASPNSAQTPAPEAKSGTKTDNAQVDDDLARRRARLSKPD